MYEEEEKKEKKKGKQVVLWIIIFILLVIILLLLLKSCQPCLLGESEEPTTGNFQVTDQQQARPEPETEPTAEVPTITFSGYGTYTVSPEAPNLELMNPAGNGVDFVFTVSDAATGTLIAKTDKVPTGSYVYVNMLDFYTEPGTYDLDIVISTYDNETGTPANGLNQKMELVVEE